MVDITLIKSDQRRERVLEAIQKDLNNEDPELKVAALKGTASLPASIIKVIYLYNYHSTTKEAILSSKFSFEDCITNKDVGVRRSAMEFLHIILFKKPIARVL